MLAARTAEAAAVVPQQVVQQLDNRWLWHLKQLMLAAIRAEVTAATWR